MDTATDTGTVDIPERVRIVCEDCDNVHVGEYAYWGANSEGPLYTVQCEGYEERYSLEAAEDVSLSVLGSQLARQEYARKYESDDTDPDLADLDTWEVATVPQPLETPIEPDGYDVVAAALAVAWDPGAGEADQDVRETSRETLERVLTARSDHGWTLYEDMLTLAREAQESWNVYTRYAGEVDRWRRAHAHTPPAHRSKRDDAKARALAAVARMVALDTEGATV